MKYLVIITLAICCFVSLSHCKIGALINNDDPFSSATIKCLSGLGVVNLMYVTLSPGQEGINQELYKIKNAGLGVDILYIPCYGLDPTSEIKQFLANVLPGLMDRVWLYPVVTTEYCGWTNPNTTRNSEVLTQYAKIFIYSKYKTGILTLKQFWYIITNNTQSFNSYPMFWVPQQFDDDASFDKYQPFGGWQKPAVKFFSQKQLCGKSVLLYYEP